VKILKDESTERLDQTQPLKALANISRSPTISSEIKSSTTTLLQRLSTHEESQEIRTYANLILENIARHSPGYVQLLSWVPPTERAGATQTTPSP
jgi:hypothetical protein